MQGLDFTVITQCGGVEPELCTRNLQCGQHLRLAQRLCSADLELFVTEVRNDFKEASEAGT